MRARWRLLFWVSLATLVGLSWLLERWNASFWQIMNGQLAGVLIGTVVAFVAMVTNARSRRIAWLALVCWLPMVYDLGGVIGHLIDFTREEGAPVVMFMIGGLLTPIVALWIALAQPPPTNDEPIARANVV